MPKVTYSASRGIVQSNGSGFIVNDVPITRSIANSGTAYTSVTGATDLTDTEEVVLFDVTGGVTVTSIADGGSVGEQRILVVTANDGSNLAITDSTISIVAPAAGSAHLLIWTGSTWVVAS